MLYQHSFCTDREGLPTVTFARSEPGFREISLSFECAMLSDQSRARGGRWPPIDPWAKFAPGGGGGRVTLGGVGDK